MSENVCGFCCFVNLKTKLKYDVYQLILQSLLLILGVHNISATISVPADDSDFFNLISFYRYRSDEQNFFCLKDFV